MTKYQGLVSSKVKMAGCKVTANGFAVEYVVEAESKVEAQQLLSEMFFRDNPQFSPSDRNFVMNVFDRK
jgi:hypothetical protein